LVALAPQRNDSAPDLHIRTSRQGHHSSACRARRAALVSVTAGWLSRPWAPVGQRGGQQRGGSGGSWWWPPCCEGCIREVFELSPGEQLARARGGENGDQGIT